MALSAACSMASVSRALRLRPRAAACSAARLGCGLGIACSMPSHGMGNEKHQLGLAVASAPAAPVTPVLRAWIGQM
ncbi:unnamed protein product [Miscanthus lutarioriparius]|uniref:Uncharacterized protein n=1 Tax=Miscanthus lutarioriparius TaxID=422564 RepID=A0A811NZR7_9POAL|nr:unnamed protein product [Miscanthus lutarioriparius]